MTTLTAPPLKAHADTGSATATTLDRIWFTRCPVPTATGLAYKLGWLTEEFARDRIELQTLQESAGSALRRHHYDHDLPSLIREGGNLLAIGARAQGAPTRLVGLTWIDEHQAILVRPETGIREPKDLKGRRLALPTWIDHPIPSHQRGSSIARGMSLHGYKGALSFAGLTFDDVTLVEVEANRASRTANPVDGAPAASLANLWSLHALANGDVDALYVKGASAVDAAHQLGLAVGINLDKLPERRFRVNNGTPRPITVHQHLIDNHFDLVVRFLHQTLRAADWARDNLSAVREVLQDETRGSAAGVTEAYSDDALRSLHPTLDAERLALFEQQKKFTWIYGFSDNDFSLDEWLDERPLDAARKLLAERG